MHGPDGRYRRLRSHQPLQILLPKIGFVSLFILVCTLSTVGAVHIDPLLVGTVPPPGRRIRTHVEDKEIGRASCRERVEDSEMTAAIEINRERSNEQSRS